MIKGRKWQEWALDAFFTISLLGIWPRFIEPRLLSVSKFDFSVPNLPKAFEGFKIIQLSDLHWNTYFPYTLLNQLNKKIQQLKPDLIVFTGDLICRAKMEHREALKQWLISLRAPMGCYAILGNHDYADYFTVNSAGDYDLDEISPESDVNKGFKRLFKRVHLTKKTTQAACQVSYNQDILNIYTETGIRLLNNETVQLELNGSEINLSGLEEYSCKRLDPVKTFQNYRSSLPGIILVHNPDAVTLLQDYPGDLILCGHTHGGEINLPLIWRKLCLIENSQLKSGLKQFGRKWIYINRGLGGVMRIRWFAPPELTFITLRSCTATN